MASIRKRSWTTNGTVKTAWVVDYCDNGGCRRQRSFQLKKEAERFLTQVKHDLLSGIHIPDSQSKSLKEACKLWLQAKREEGLEASTILGYDQIVRLHICPLIGFVKLSRLTKVTIEDFRDELLRTRTRSTAERALLYCKIILEESVRKGWIAQNVAKLVKIKNRGRHKRRPIIPSRTDLLALLDAAEASGDVEKEAFIKILIFSGIRMSEIRGLTWDNLNFEKQTVTINKRADFQCVIGAPKSESSFRSIPLTTSCVETLKVWRNKSAGLAHGLVFPSKAGTPRSYLSCIRNLFDPLMELAGLLVLKLKRLFHKFSPHALRHAAASIWIEKGFSAKRIQVWMGHSSIQVTFDLYGWLFDIREADPKIMDSVEASLRDGFATGPILPAT